ncbi:Peptidoglycan/LPS O-acetylase OafA/YrhL, contains acyltransferase and SGNH-hydrolase domains [Pseudonocardia thermophila]|jgi:Predicted acyltransferases|uniref:Peptidoglycan/LPS O-acetylase OafA/YrhL, contains acyltransferase and SGNH-hydrolase domains n=1 Tax=Pseudonocardia thermophila TaxID=1848 RepID=A0A1M6NR27_PSETH|nr:acyltransferase family protein [Pseudonocardia thermophila]SHJ98076.1 Peptidoglycan/LPS O-acetylase OafA/YrhL, contains acyltransferase and SGNH-hydrolase domains [Pseudonocardia thermophila]
MRRPVQWQAAPPSLAARHRPEVQGLRAVAVFLIVVYHVWIGRVSGGVDVFFVLTGFLLTGGLVRAAEQGRLNLRARWTRTLARLVPAASVVLVAVVAAGMWLLPAGRWSQTVREVAAAALFAENWQLAADAVDYEARSQATSVVQHFWSLAIQGQVFFLFPLLVAVIALACGRRTELIRGRVTLALLWLGAASLLFSIGQTADNQPLAYFHTTTRLWEFAVGGLLALHLDRLVLAWKLRIAAGWAGVLGLVACGALLPVASTFPGWIALWPVTCTALVLAAGATGSRLGVDRLLTNPVARWIGDRSYAIYLWHWPILIMVMAVTGGTFADLPTGLAIVAAAVVAAAFTHRFVEEPAARRGGLRIPAVATAAVLVATVAWQAAAMLADRPSGAAGAPTHPGALALADTSIDPAAWEGVPPVPPLVSVHEDWERIERWNCRPLQGFPQDLCTRPRPGAQEPPARRVVVVGDSHAQQLSAALGPIADAENWELTDIVRGACPFSTVSENDPDDADCVAWLAAAFDEIAALRPDVVVTLATRTVRVGLTEHTPAGFVEQWRRLADLGIPVLALRDNPRFDESMPDCVARNSEDPSVCGADRADLYAPEPPWVRAEGVPPTVSFLDIADAVCTPDRCPAVIGNVLVYLDDNHLTATYATTMAPLIADRVRAAIGSP